MLYIVEPESTNALRSVNVEDYQGRRTRFESTIRQCIDSNLRVLNTSSAPKEDSFM